MAAAELVYLNGGYLPLAAATVPVLDRGFLFGDGVYEVIPVYRGQLFHWPDHWRRLEESLAGIRLPNPHTQAQWLDIFAPLIKAGGHDQYLYLQITRGAAAKRDHAFPAHVTPTVLVMCQDILPFAGKLTGIDAITVADSRWQRCNLKTIALLANILHRQAAVDEGAAEAILVRDGLVTEGAASNVFAVVNGQLRTPPKDQAILAGITRDVILALARQHLLPCQEGPLPVAELRAADEVWVTSSTREIVPVVRLDGAPVGSGVGDGQPGPWFRRMDALFQAYKQAVS